MSAWQSLMDELDRWPAGTATFWWRDDDATAASPALDRLPALSDQPLALAGIPARGPRRPGAAGPFRANAHVDIVDWRDDRQFIGVTTAIALAVGHLAQRRRGNADANEPTGLLTHHLVMDDAAYAFTGEFLARSAAHP